MSEIKVGLLVTDFECDPSEVTRIINLEPTFTWRTGDLISKTGKGTAKHKENGWEWCLPPLEGAEGVDFSVLFDRFVAEIAPIQERFKLLPSNHYVQLSCCAYIKEQAPAFVLDSSILQLLASINATVDFDIYCLD